MRDRVKRVAEEKESKYYIVSRHILPEAIKKTAEVKELLVRGEAKTVNAAVKKVGLSRSAFYKYRNGVIPFHRAVHNRVITMSLLMDHKPGVLSAVLNTIAAEQGKILTINQSIPLQGLANATISIDTTGLPVSIETLLQAVNLTKGVKKVEVIGQS